MIKLKSILQLAKDLTLGLLHENEIFVKKISSKFNTENTEEIIERIKNIEDQNDRAALVEIINQHKQDDWNKINKQINSSIKIQYLKIFSRIAAIFILGLGIAYFYQLENPSKANLNSTDITLTLANGEVEILTAKDKFKIRDKTGKVLGSKTGNKLNYNFKKNISNKLAYNKLFVPYGKTFQLLLSDGTSVHLNSGTTLKYPVNFIKGKKRKVFLTGEAYFDVTKDKADPFIVQSNNLNIRVLGTQFNVSSYPEDININTTLVEGSVGLYTKGQSFNSKKVVLLKPGNKAVWKKESNTVFITKVNTHLYTSWIHGQIMFKELAFKHIIKKLERHYNVSITNNNKDLNKQIYTATFNTESIQEVLNSFKANFPFNYTVKGMQIEIN